MALINLFVGSDLFCWGSKGQHWHDTGTSHMSVKYWCWLWDGIVGGGAYLNIWTQPQLLNVRLYAVAEAIRTYMLQLVRNTDASFCGSVQSPQHNDCLFCSS